MQRPRLIWVLTALAMGAVGLPPGGYPAALRVEEVVRGLEVPWALAFASDGRLFLTERPGRIRLIRDGSLRPEPVAELAVAAVGEAGLLGLALDPAFDRNGYLYVYLTAHTEGGGLRNRVVRLTERAGKASGLTVLLDGIPGAGIHDGGRIKFGPDGKLYITTGDAADPPIAKDLRSLGGKILRINPDGSIPEDNPFPGSPVWSYGHRNPQGIAWHPRTGKLFATEHGTSVHDEVNIIEPGKDYGWPTAIGPVRDPRFVDPILTFTPNIAPSGAAFISRSRYPGWEGDFLFATLRCRHLHRAVLRSPDFGAVQSHERLLDGQYGRLRDVVLGPDGSLYVATNNRDGRGTPSEGDDRILRLLP